MKVLDKALRYFSGIVYQNYNCWSQSNSKGLSHSQSLSKNKV